MVSTEDQVDVLNRILALTSILSDDTSRSLADVGLTTSRVPVLWRIHLGGPSTQRQLADAMHVSARNVTGLVDGLVQTGFVTREPHPTDRRATQVTLTRRGAKVARDLEQQQHELAAQLFADMPTATFNGLRDGLDQVLARLRVLIVGDS